jgi:thioredoxin reductase (NADPH)
MTNSSPRSLSHPLIIIGGGPAALTAAIYAARARLNPLVYTGPQPGGQLMSTTLVENWPGTPTILGPQLMQTMQQHAVHAGAHIREATITALTVHAGIFTLTSARETTTAATVIVATGTTPRRLACPGEDTYWGRGISTCAVCDGALYRDKRVLVIGGGDTAMEEALFLAKFTPHVTIAQIHDRFTASAIMQERVLATPAITARYTTRVTEFSGDGSRVAQATLLNTSTNTAEIVPFDGIFLAIGSTPNSSLVADLVERDKQGYIITTEGTHTSVPGLFAAGDVVDKRYRQAVTAAGDGCRAALDVERFLQEHST